MLFIKKYVKPGEWPNTIKTKTFKVVIATLLIFNKTLIFWGFITKTQNW